MKKPLTKEHATVLNNIISDAVMRIDALAERGGYGVAHLRSTAVGGFALHAMRAGQCRGELLEKLKTFCQGRCNCDVETKGST